MLKENKKQNTWEKQIKLIAERFEDLENELRAQNFKEAAFFLGTAEYSFRDKIAREAMKSQKKSTRC